MAMLSENRWWLVIHTSQGNAEARGNFSKGVSDCQQWGRADSHRMFCRRQARGRAQNVMCELAGRCGQKGHHKPLMEGREVDVVSCELGSLVNLQSLPALPLQVRTVHSLRIMRAALSPERATAGTPPPGVVQWPARYRLGMGVFCSGLLRNI